MIAYKTEDGSRELSASLHPKTGNLRVMFRQLGQPASWVFFHSEDAAVDFLEDVLDMMEEAECTR